MPLNHPDVDDPSREEIGLIRVEFRLEKEQEHTIWDGDIIEFEDWDHYWNENLDFSIITDCVSCSNTSAESGATIGGSESNQKFHKVDIEFEDKTWIVEIRLRGIKR